MELFVVCKEKLDAAH